MQYPTFGRSVGRFLREIFFVVWQNFSVSFSTTFCSNSHILCTHVHTQHNTNRAAHTRLYFVVLMYVFACMCVSYVCATNRVSLCHFLSKIILKRCISDRSNHLTIFSLFISFSLIHCLVVLSVVLVCFSFFL